MAIVSDEAQMKVQTKRHHHMNKENFPTMMCTIFRCHNSHATCKGQKRKCLQPFLGDNENLFNQFQSKKDYKTETKTDETILKTFYRWEQ